MDPNQKNDTTVVTEVEMNADELNDILGTPGSETIMVPNEDKTPSFFSTKPVDLSFLNKQEKVIPTETKEEKPKEEEKPIIEKEIVTNTEIDNLLAPEVELDSQTDKTKTKSSKDALVDFTTKMIEKGTILPFDEDKPLDKYTYEDFQELFEENIKQREKKIREEAPIEFFDALPDELQYAAKYVADGGTDLKGLFKTLAASEEIRELDPKDEKNHRLIVRSYLQATHPDMTADEIEEEIDGWEDKNELEAKALKFKPKLDNMQQQIIAAKLQKQEETRIQREKQSQMYMDNIYKVLEPGDLNGIKLDKKMQGFLFSGLVEPRYPSITGRGTNLLGHLLEKYQYVEPNHALIAEALWLLSDPQSYKEKVKESGKKEVTEKHVRMLKQEQANRLSSTEPSEDGLSSKPSPNKIARPSKDFFKR